MKSSRPAFLARVGRLLVPLACVALVIATAIGCAFSLQFSTYLDWSKRAPAEVVLHPLDVAVLAAVIVALWAVIGRLGWVVALVSGVTLLLAGINHNKILLRREPLFPADRSFAADAGSLLSMVDVGMVVRSAAVVIGVVIVIAVAGWLLGKRFPRTRLRLPDGGLNPRVLGVRLGAFVLAAGLLVQATQFNDPGNSWRALYDQGARWKPWSQTHNYRTNGFVGGFLYNMPVAVMEEPEGYDAAAMAQISQKYALRAEQINAERTGSLEDANVVFILSESFTDPSWMKGLPLAENPIPATQQVMTETIAGKMYTMSYGGGTSTVEFETLTGQSVGLFNPQVASPYQMFVGDQPDYPSAVGAFSAMGHRTVAIHSYNLDMYKRKQVYATLGFDEVIDDAAMQSRKHIDTSRYISDEAAFGEVLHQLDAKEGPEFINLVTMQNHGTYGGNYSDPIESDADEATKAKDYGQYARGLAHTDAALTDFLNALEERDETTIVVFYGDHHPGIYSDGVVKQNPDSQFTTPFFVWNSSTNQAQEVPAVGPAMFLPLAYEAADAPVPGYVALLDDVRRSVPVIQPARTLDAEGQPVDLADLDAETAELVEDLRLVQYDFSIGGRYATDDMWSGAVVDQKQS